MKKIINILLFFILLFAISSCKEPETQQPVSYIVTFEANGGNPVPQNQTVIQGSTISEPLSMTKTGYGFGGWYKEIECINLWDFANDTVTSNITLYAMWDTNYYEVSFENNEGIPVLEHQYIIYNGKVVTPSEISKEGYIFDGWYKETACINQWDFSTDIVTCDIILYAKWLKIYTVTFIPNGGSPEPIQQIIVNGNKVFEPQTITKSGFNFDGWYKEDTYQNLWDFNNDIIIENTILYAKWGPSILVPGANYNMKIRWLEENVVSNGDYTIEFDSNQSIDTATLLYNGKNNITISLKGIGASPITINAISGSMFIIGSGVTLILSDNIELCGKSGNNASLIRVNSGGNFIMNSGTSIVDNTYSTSSYTGYPQGGGIYVADNGVFTMNGGEISNNSTTNSYSTQGAVYSYGGGVYISNGTFIMNDGKIYDNSANYSSTNGSARSCGGGVFIDNNGIFIMNNGEISNNSVSGTSTYSAYGGGVYINNGIFTMNDGKIFGNSGNEIYINSGDFIMNGGEISGDITSSSVRGVYVNGGTFTINGGKLFGYINSSLSSYVGNAGGGVYVHGGTINMDGGEIFGNISSSYGGGVYISSFGIFNMTNGNIYGNTSLLSGGGVYVDSSVFNKSGGTIYGFIDGSSNSNMVKNSSEEIQQNLGHAVQIYHDNSIYRMGKDTTSDELNILYFNGKITPPSSSGAWDY